MSEFFKGIGKISFEGKDSKNPLAFKHYNPDEVIGGKTMKEQLKFALSWWHTMGGDGTDMFGCGTTDKTWGEDDSAARAKAKVDAAFEIMDKLSIDYFCFHDRDLSPEYGSLSETNAKLDEITDYIAEKMKADTSKKCLWVLPSALTTRDSCTEPERLRLPTFSLSPRLRLKRLLKRQLSSEATAMYSGADARAMKLSLTQIWDLNRTTWRVL